MSDDKYRHDLPAVYHEHEGSAEHTHDKMGPAHHSGNYGHFHLTEVYTSEEIAEFLLGVADE